MKFGNSVLLVRETIKKWKYILKFIFVYILAQVIRYKKKKKIYNTVVWQTLPNAIIKLTCVSMYECKVIYVQYYKSIVFSTIALPLSIVDTKARLF